MARSVAEQLMTKVDRDQSLAALLKRHQEAREELAVKETELAKLKWQLQEAGSVVSVFRYDPAAGELAVGWTDELVWPSVKELTAAFKAVLNLTDEITAVQERVREMDRAMPERPGSTVATGGAARPAGGVHGGRHRGARF